MKIILIHGKDATPQDKWYPWFSDQVEKLGYGYAAPELPNPSEPVFKEWIEGLNSCNPNEETILIGHSRGGAAVLRWLEMQPKGLKIKKVILIAANAGKMESNLPAEEHKKGFYDESGYNFENIKSHCDDFVVFHSTDDQWVPYSHGEENALGLNATFRSYTDKGHFGRNLGGEFPELLTEITLHDTHHELLDIIDEDENIIGQATRNEVHERGLLHREVHVWVHTPDGKIAFQKRSATKETYPNLLDASAGGHVDLGMTFEQAALMELEEEAGITATPDKITFLQKQRLHGKDGETGRINNTLKYVYGYLHEGEKSDLVAEPGKSDGFEWYTVQELQNLSTQEKEKFISFLLTDESFEIYRKITKQIQ